MIEMISWVDAVLWTGIGVLALLLPRPANGATLDENCDHRD